ncbi:hypothetical protein [Archangium sp.]|jgi:hypothetical protein|uniref:hypothetical protein n=1 Tax=Archangium sp. TaxID=1872627 RepID=UPI002EDB8D15
MNWNIRKHGRIAPTAVLALASFALLAGCGKLQKVREAIDGPYHRLAAGTGGVYLTIKGNATNCMTSFYDGCRKNGESSTACARVLLDLSRGKIEESLEGRAKELWNGQYSVYGFHPNIGKGFRSEEAGDLATAVQDLRSRNHECLRVHWKPTGTNWTTQDGSATECSPGALVLDDKDKPISCPAA